jgi:epoxide hydrolase-like predicted phosphatase
MRDKSPMIRAALFDIGNVILPFDFSLAEAKIKARSRAQDPAAWAAFAALKIAYEGGRIDRAAFFAGMRQQVGFAGTDAEFRLIWEDIFSSNPPMDAVIKRLHRDGLPLYLLSNTNDIHVDAFRARYPIFGDFSGAVYSHEEGLLKPDPEIFRRAIERFSLTPTETIYIDDLTPNLDAAAALGFLALPYNYRAHHDFEKRLWAEL